MGDPVEPELVEAGHVERPVRAIRPVEVDKLLGEIVEIEPAELLLLLGQHLGAKGAEALEERAPEPLGVDEVVGHDPAHGGVELLQGGKGLGFAVGLGHLHLGDVLFEPECPFQVHAGEGLGQGGRHLGGEGAFRGPGQGLHLGPQPFVFGGEARLLGLEPLQQLFRALPCIEGLLALVQGRQQRFGGQAQDAGRDHDALHIRQHPGVLKEAGVGKLGDQGLFVVVGHLGHVGLGGEEAVEEGVDGRKMDLGGPHDEPSFSAGAFVPLVDGLQDPLFHLRGRGVGEGGGDHELPGASPGGGGPAG